MEIETIGGAPTPPIPAILGGNDWAQDGCIKFGVAKTPLDPVYNAEYCDPILGHNNNKVRLTLFAEFLLLLLPQQDSSLDCLLNYQPFCPSFSPKFTGFLP